MTTQNIIIGLIVAAVLVIGGFFLLGDTSAPSNTSNSSESEEPSSRSFDQAPSFSLEDYDGNIVSSADFEGKILVVNSWATWCPFCVDELPDFGELQEEFSDDVVVIAIDRSESRERAKGFSDDLGVTGKMTLLLDPKDSFYRSIGGFAMPETLFVDAEGNIRVHKRGPMELEEMRGHINNILSS